MRSVHFEASRWDRVSPSGAVASLLAFRLTMVNDEEVEAMTKYLLVQMCCDRLQLKVE